MESIVGHRIDGNWVGLWEASGTYPAKINPSANHPPPPGGALTICTEILVKNFGQMVPVFFLAPEKGTGLSYTI